MNTQFVSSKEMVRAIVSRDVRIQKALLTCGIVSSLLYVAINILGAMQWEGYSSISQTFSELIAIDAPSRPLAVPLSIMYAVLIYAFGLGIWKSAGQKRSLRMAAILIMLKEVLGLVVTLFAPIHMRGIAGTNSDTMHGILTFVGVLFCMFPAMGFGAAAFGKYFRIYTIGTMAIFLVFGILAGQYQPAYVANLPTPWMGFYERINIYGYLLWIVVLAVTLLRAQPDNLRIKDNESLPISIPEANKI
jgi:hypothetical protein